MTDPRPDRPSPRARTTPPRSAPPDPITLAVVNLKGGAGKTTTAAFVAHALHELGRRVLAVDADPQASLLTWQQSTEWPFPCVGLPSGRLHRELSGIVGDRFDATVIDTPGTENGRPISLSAAKAATHVLVPCAPTGVEFERLRDMHSLFQDATDARPDEVPPVVGVLLVRTIPSASSTDVFREVMTADGWPVLRAAVGRLERFAQAYGQPIEGALGTGYGDAVRQLLDTTVGVGHGQ